MSGGEYYAHPFMEVRSNIHYNTKTAACLLQVEKDVKNRASCVIKVKIIGIAVALNEAVEGPLFSSTYSIEFLNDIVDKVHNAFRVTQKAGDIPCIINWAEVNAQGGRKSTVYLIYSKVSEGRPWVVASFSNKHTGTGRVSFLAVVPSDVGQVIEACQDNDEDLVLEIV